MAGDTLSLAGKIAIVTGSGKENGIGAGIVRALARNGAAVTINCVSDNTLPRAEAFAETLRTQGQRVAVVQADVSTFEGAKKIVDETLKAFDCDKIDILGKTDQYLIVLSGANDKVNNAGLPGFGPTLEYEEAVIDKILSVNIKGTILMAQAAVPLMPSGGRVINVSSSSSKRGEHLIPLYGATKAAIDSLTYSWASEV